MAFTTERDPRAVERRSRPVRGQRDRRMRRHAAISWGRLRRTQTSGEKVACPVRSSAPVCNVGLHSGVLRYVATPTTIPRQIPKAPRFAPRQIGNATAMLAGLPLPSGSARRPATRPPLHYRRPIAVLSRWPAAHGDPLWLLPQLHAASSKERRFRARRTSGSSAAPSPLAVRAAVT